VERIVGHLEQLGEVEPAGTTWPAREPGYRDLGLLHGVPGVVAFLAGALSQGVARARARALLVRGVAWLRRQRLEERGATCFPAFRLFSGERAESRTAWCYGDPGVALALHHAARALDDVALAREAALLARTALERPVALTGALDAGLCHGFAGLGQIAARFHRFTGEPVFARLARTWLERALDAGSFAALVRQADGSLGPVDAPGLLVGASGVALALLGAATPLATGWDGFLFGSMADE
jgi:hypothetical protein